MNALMRWLRSMFHSTDELQDLRNAIAGKDAKIGDLAARLLREQHTNEKNEKAMDWFAKNCNEKLDKLTSELADLKASKQRVVEACGAKDKMIKELMQGNEAAMARIGELEHRCGQLLASARQQDKVVVDLGEVLSKEQTKRDAAESRLNRAMALLSGQESLP